MNVTNEGEGQVVKHIKMRPYQSGFTRSKHRFPAMVSAWGTGKTMFGILKAVKQCEQYPNNEWLIVRKEFTRLEDSTIPDFEKYTGLKVGSDKNVKFENGSLFMFRHGEQVNNSDVLANMNLGGFVIEQAEEFSTDNEFNMLRGRLRRDGVPHYGCVIANTKGHNWIWKTWKIKDTERPSDEEIKRMSKESGLSYKEVEEAYDPRSYDLYEANSYDNKRNLPLDFIQDLVRMQKDSPHIYNRFVLNSWEDIDTEEKVIPYSWIKAAIGNSYHTLRDKTIVACDPCGVAEAGGGDEGVIYGIKNGKVIAHDFFNNKQPDQIASRCKAMRIDIKAQAIVVDVIGPGSGVVSWLSKTGERNIISVNSSERSELTDPLCFNRRAEIWWTARIAFRESQASIPDDPILIEELSQTGLELTPRGYKIESKDDLKKADRIGHSPNRADCLVYGLWGLTQIGYDNEAIYPDDEGEGSDENDLVESYATKSEFE